MPTINKKKKVYNKNKFNNNYKYVYNTDRWKKLRMEYIKQNPLCENCLKDGIYSSTKEVHHIIPLSSKGDIVEKMNIGFDFDNLMALCSECHKKIHKNNDNSR